MLTALTLPFHSLSSSSSGVFFYEHLQLDVGVVFDPAEWMLLPHINGGPAFLRRKREETSRLVFIRERAHAYVTGDDGAPSPSLLSPWLRG